MIAWTLSYQILARYFETFLKGKKNTLDFGEYIFYLNDA